MKKSKKYALLSAVACVVMLLVAGCDPCAEVGKNCRGVCRDYGIAEFRCVADEAPVCRCDEAPR